MPILQKAHKSDRETSDSSIEPTNPNIKNTQKTETTVKSLETIVFYRQKAVKKGVLTGC